MTGLGKTKIYELQSEGTFPMRVQITAHSVGWVEAEVQAWLLGRIEASTALRTRLDRKASKVLTLMLESSLKAPKHLTLIWWSKILLGCDLAPSN